MLRGCRVFNGGGDGGDPLPSRPSPSPSRLVLPINIFSSPPPEVLSPQSLTFVSARCANDNLNSLIFTEDRIRLYAGTVPANKEYAACTVPANKEYAADTVPANKEYAAGTP